ncbi:MAG TPA: NAD-dependent succinate-semialdehyde dehydrogenase [Rubricoccaceae bacterium]|nr:NAD-dependent succinate-semialdehyde dehydrogenase [Rubricoccaceae bacterium]
MAATYTTVDPTTGAPLATHALLDGAALEAALARAADAFARHRQTPFAERAEKLNRLADLLEREKRQHAERMVREMGKPITQAVAEAEKCVLGCRYYAEHAARFLADEPRATEADRSVVAYEPLGPVLAVMPWNFPYWQVFRFAAPAVMAGNVGLLKHAKNVLACGDAIADLFREAGFAEGVFQHLPVETDQVERIVRDPRVAAATLTGSEGAGRAVATAAADSLKKTVLELGGSDAFVVLADADLDHAVEIGVTARVQNNGESCIAAKRFILEKPIAEAFARRFTDAMAALQVGDPMDEATQVGPLARKDLRDEVHGQVERAVAEGAEVLTGGRIPDGPGFFYPPTVLANVREGTVAFDEEIFGPVASLVAAEDADDAVRLANASRFGLGGAVFTRDVAKGERVARALACGSAFVNAMVRSHPNVPFGGVKASGYGRELGPEGIREFVNVKTLWVEHGRGSGKPMAAE